MWRVRQVISLETKLSLHLLGHAEVLEEGKVDVRTTGTSDNIAPGSSWSDINASRVLGRYSEGGGIHIILKVSWMHVNRADEGRSRGTGIAANRDAERGTAQQRVNTVEFPTADYVAHPPGHVAPPPLSPPHGQSAPPAQHHSVPLHL